MSSWCTVIILTCAAVKEFVEPVYIQTKMAIVTKHANVI
jgi:hypothetical protein